MTSLSHMDHHRLKANSPFFTGSAEIAGALIWQRRGAPPHPFHLSVLELPPLARHLASQSVAPAVAPYLSEAETALFATFRHSKRRLQWFGGRLAIKHALRQLIGPDDFSQEKALGEISVLNQASGRPYLHLPAESPRQYAISLSHSDRYAVGIATTAPTCGIDIQLITERILRVAEKFSTPSELRLLATIPHDLSETALLTMLWSAKEAVKKGLLHDQPVIFSGIHLTGVRQNDFFHLEFSCASPRQSAVIVTAVPLGDFMLAFTLGETIHA